MQCYDENEDFISNRESKIKAKEKNKFKLFGLKERVQKNRKKKRHKKNEI